MRLVIAVTAIWLPHGPRLQVGRSHRSGRLTVLCLRQLFALASWRYTNRIAVMLRSFGAHTHADDTFGTDALFGHAAYHL